MFLRFSKGSYSRVCGKLHTVRKCAFIGDSVVMEYGSRIVGIAKLHEETPTCKDYDIVVANKCELSAERIARFIKDLIGKANKFDENHSTKRRKYFVEEVDCEALPISAKLVFSKI